MHMLGRLALSCYAMLTLFGCRPAGTEDGLPSPRSALFALSMALDSYYHENQVLPKDYSDGENPTMSWRVAVARALDSPGASRQLKTDERWDSPANRAHLAPMPPMFQSTEEDAGMTCVVLVKGSGPFSGFGTGGPKTIVAAYLKKEKAVPWAEPRDVEYRDVADVAQYVLLSDGSVVPLDAMSGGTDVKSTGAH